MGDQLMGRYRKFIVAAVGAAIAILTHHFGPAASIVVDLEIAATAAGVWGFPNEAS